MLAPIVITMEGGLIQHIGCTDLERERSVVIIDYDTEDMNAEELDSVPQGDRPNADGYIIHCRLDLTDDHISEWAATYVEEHS